MHLTGLMGESGETQHVGSRYWENCPPRTCRRQMRGCVLMADALTPGFPRLGQRAARSLPPMARTTNRPAIGHRGSGPDNAATCTSDFCLPGFLTRHTRTNESLQPREAVGED